MMPVVRRESRWPAGKDRVALVEALVKELAGESTPGGPVIFELDHENIVVWDEWGGISNIQRASIIRDAYKERHQQLHPSSDPEGESAGSVLGATVDEAVENDLLPYIVRPTYTNVPTEHIQEFQEVERAMFEAGAIKFGNRPMLAFPSRDLAEDVLLRMKKALPGVEWNIQQG